MGSFLKTVARDISREGELPGYLQSLELGTNNPQLSDSSGLIPALG